MQHVTDAHVGRKRWRLLLVVLGAALLVGSALVGFTGWTDTHKHDVRELGASAGETVDGEVLASEDLTVAEQAVVLDTITADAPVWTSDPVGLLFRYPDAPHSNEYLIELDGVFYVLETAEELRPLAIVATGLRLSLAVGGGMLFVAGAVPLSRSLLGQGTPLSRELKRLFGMWLPTWGLLVLAPPAVLALVYPVMFETVVDVPLNLFVTPFLVATGLCAAGTALVLWVVDLPDPVVLVSVVNVTVLWSVAVAYVVSPAAGEGQALLTLLVGVASSSVLVGVTIGWYVMYWREVRRSEYPNPPAYWRI